MWLCENENRDSYQIMLEQRMYSLTVSINGDALTH